MAETQIIHSDCLTDDTPKAVSDCQNASEEHRRLAAMSVRWLANRQTHRGIRAARELWLASGYVADTVALASLQWRYYCELISERERSGHSCNPPSHYWAFVFEVKVSRADFQGMFGSGKGNRLTPIGNVHYLVTPKRLVVTDEVPDFWGLLERAGSGLRMVKKPVVQSQSDATIDAIGHRMLWHADRGHDANS